MIYPFFQNRKLGFIIAEICLAVSILVYLASSFFLSSQINLGIFFLLISLIFIVRFIEKRKFLNLITFLVFFGSAVYLIYFK
ncbi:hypothetical protein Elgi_14930 [Paenibacillus elgii]|nr:hypothetical protein Elgi_14930 [Paenibacillus elgii]